LSTHKKFQPSRSFCSQVIPLQTSHISNVLQICSHNTDFQKFMILVNFLDKILTKNSNVIIHHVVTV